MLYEYIFNTCPAETLKTGVIIKNHVRKYKSKAIARHDEENGYC
ncbi:Uncharacterised protein [uncultured archaeon]|nr:Uncharacterised protein [uncultured archaeon]